MSESAVRLLGAGALAVQIPAGWPVRSGLFVVKRSTVVLGAALTQAVGIWSPVNGAVSITFDHPPIEPFDGAFRRAGDEAETVELVSGERVIWSEGTRWSVDRKDRHHGMTIWAPTLGGRIDIAGPEDVVRALASTASRVPDGCAAVPNVLLGRRKAPLQAMKGPSEKQARLLLEDAGLKVATDPPEIEGDRRKNLVPTGTSPTAGSVVPVGTTITVHLVRAH